MLTEWRARFALSRCVEWAMQCLAVRVKVSNADANLLFTSSGIVTTVFENKMIPVVKRMSRWTKEGA